MAVTRDQVAALYVATFNRAPLSEGLDYWTSSDFTIGMIADSFFEQPEAQAIYTNDGEDISSKELIIRIFDNLFNRLPKVAGLDYWMAALDSGAASKSEMILAIMNGATGDDATMLANKTTAGLYYADQGGSSTDFFLDNIDETEGSLTNAMAAIDSALAVSVDFQLDENTDTITGTSNDDVFEAPIVQNPWAGGVSNSLSTADTIDGGAGTDTLEAELVPEFYGVTGNNQMNIQPDIQSVEDIRFEAMDVSSLNMIEGAITVDAKDITDVVKIGSAYSDGDLRIENLTTLTSGGTIRNTEDITIVMDHTDNFDSDGDASDLTVLFDEDYLVSGQTSEASTFWWLLDEKAEAADPPPVDPDTGEVLRLNEINVDGLRFTVGDDPTEYKISDAAIPSRPGQPGTGRTHEAFVAELQDELLDLIADGTLPEGSTLTLDYNNTDVTGLDFDDSPKDVSDPIPAIVLTSGDGTPVTAVGFNQIDNLLEEYDVYGVFDSESETAVNPITVNIELEKVGRDGEGGNLIVGGKDQNLADDSDVDQTDGIEVFNIAVNGNNDQPSNLGQVASTNLTLDTVNIADGTSWDGAELTIRDLLGAGQELTLINSTGFSGDFSLAMSALTSQQALTSNFGAGNDSYDWMSVEVDAVSSGKDYSISMGAGNDTVIATLDGDSVDAITESFTLDTGAGDDYVTMVRNDGAEDGVSQATMAILDNIDIELGAGDDVLDMNNNFNANIDAGAGDDFVFMNGNGTGGFITIGQSTGAQNFGQRVLFNAELTISYAGFEATIDVPTTSADGYVADQTIINEAVMDAINGDDVLSKLLVADLDDGGQQLTITPTHADTDAGIALALEGQNSIGIAIYQPELVAANAAAGQVALTGSALSALETGFIATTNLDSDDFVNVPTAVAAIGALPWAGAVNENGVGDNLVYTEIERDFEDGRGAQIDDILDDAADNYFDYAAIGTDATGASINFSTIELGTGDDIVVMQSNDLNPGVLKITGSFGNDSVVNWHTAPTHTITNANQMGFNALDFTELLDNQIDPSATTNTNSAQDVAITANIVAGYEAVTGLSVGVFNNNTAVANGVNVIRFTENVVNNETFENLTASVLVSALNNGGTAYGNINDNTLDVATAANGIVIGGTAKHIVMVENSTNEGQYKVFYLESDDDSTTNVNADFNTAGAVELGELDFGASINLPLVGSDAYKSLIDNFTVALDNEAASFTYDADGNGTVSAGEGETILDGTTPVEPGNNAPVANADTETGDVSDALITIDVLANDTDDDGDTLTITGVDAVNAAIGTVATDGAVITFDPADGAVAQDVTFNYDIADGNGGTATGTVTLTLTDNSVTPPVGNLIDIVEGTEGNVAATADEDIFSFDVVSALGMEANSQTTITGFDTAADSLLLDIATPGGETTLDALAGVDGIIVQSNPVTGTTINFGNDANGDVVVVQLAGISDASSVTIEVA